MIDQPETPRPFVPVEERPRVKIKALVERLGQENGPGFSAIRDFTRQCELERELAKLVQKPQESDLPEWERTHRVAQLDSEIGALNAIVYQGKRDPAYHRGYQDIKTGWEALLADSTNLQRDDPVTDSFVYLKTSLGTTEHVQRAEWARSQMEPGLMEQLCCFSNPFLNYSGSSFGYCRNRQTTS